MNIEAWPNDLYWEVKDWESNNLCQYILKNKTHDYFFSNNEWHIIGEKRPGPLFLRLAIPNGENTKKENGFAYLGFFIKVSDDDEDNYKRSSLNDIMDLLPDEFKDFIIFNLDE